MAVNYSILTDVEFSTKGIKKNLQDAVNKAGAKAKVGLEVEGTNQVKELNSALGDTNLILQAANELFRRSVEVISAVVTQVYALDDSLTEFKKVSNLSDSALDSYVDKLSDMGQEVARTGKPKCQAPNVGMINQHLYPLEIQYSLRAYSTTMVI